MGDHARPFVGAVVFIIAEAGRTKPTAMSVRGSRPMRNTAGRNLVRHLASANFGEYSNVLWQLLESRWKEEAVVSAAAAAVASSGGFGAAAGQPSAACSGGVDKLVMVSAITLMVFVSNYSSGAFVALTPTFATDFWGTSNGTNDAGGVVPLAGEPYFGYVEGVGILQTSGQVVRASLGLVAGLVVAAAAPGPGLKQRLTAMVVFSSLLNLGTVLGMMFATGYWAYFTWCVECAHMRACAQACARECARARWMNPSSARVSACSLHGVHTRVCGRSSFMRPA